MPGPKNPQEAFLDLLIAAMSDAANGNLTQIQTTIDPDGKGIRLIRIIVVPEKMAVSWPVDQPLGTPKPNTGN